MKHLTKKQTGLFAATLLFAASQALAQGGGEWGNGEGGFSRNELDPKQIMPLDEPLTITQVQCKLQIPQAGEDEGLVVGENYYLYFYRNWRNALVRHEEKSLTGIFEFILKSKDISLECKRETKSVTTLPEMEKLAESNDKLLETQSNRIKSGVNLLQYIRFETDGTSYELIPGYAYQLESALEFSGNSNSVTIKLKGLPKKKRADLLQTLERATRSRGSVGLYFLDIGISASLAINYQAWPDAPVQFPQHSTQRSIFRYYGAPTDIEIAMPYSLSAQDHDLLNNLNALLKRLPIVELTTPLASMAQIFTQLPLYEGYLAAIQQGIKDLEPIRQHPIARALRYKLHKLVEAYQTAIATGGLTAPATRGDFSIEQTRETWTDENEMEQSQAKIRDRLLRLQFKYPKPIELNDPRGCAYVLDIAETIRDLHNAYLAPKDWPNSFYGSSYLRKIHELMEWLNQLSYRPDSRGDFLDQILPNWQKVCKAERNQLEDILASFQ